MKYAHEKRLIGVVLGLALMAGACGQSHVEYSKKEGGPAGAPIPVIALEGDDETNWDGIVDPAKLRVTSTALRTSVGETPTNHSWQYWPIPRKTGAALNIEEIESNGDYPTIDQQADQYESSYSLKGVEMRRCVYRNRNIPFHSNTMVLVNETELICIPMLGEIIENSQIRFNVFRNPHASENTATVQLVGSTARKTIAKRGNDTLQVKLTARLGPKQAYGGAAKAVLSDDMDVLLSTHFVGQKPDPACGMQRSFLFTINFKDARPVSAQVAVRTSQHSVQEFENMVADSPFLGSSFTQNTAREPQVNLSAANGCQLQHMAWAECAYVPSNTDLGATRTERCAPQVGKALDKNFKSLLRSAATINGYTHKLFFLNRDEANTLNRKGMKSGLWHDSAVSATDKNPLSVEDFQEFVDIIDLKM